MISFWKSLNTLFFWQKYHLHHNLCTLLNIIPCSCVHQDSDDEGNYNDDDEEKPSIKKEFSGRSPSPAAEDSEPEMTEEEKEFQLVSLILFCISTVVVAYSSKRLIYK